MFNNIKKSFAISFELIWSKLQKCPKSIDQLYVILNVTFRGSVEMIKYLNGIQRFRKKPKAGTHIHSSKSVKNKILPQFYNIMNKNKQNDSFLWTPLLKEAGLFTLIWPLVRPWTSKGIRSYHIPYHNDPWYDLEFVTELHIIWQHHWNDEHRDINSGNYKPLTITTKYIIIIMWI